MPTRTSVYACDSLAHFSVQQLCCASHFPSFCRLTFWQKTFRHGHFIIGTFQYVQVSALRTYRHMDISSLWTLLYKNFSAWGLFKHKDFLAQEPFNTVAQGSRSLCQNVHTARKVPKYPCAEIFRCSNIPCRFVVLSMAPKIPCAKMSPSQKILLLKCPWTRNVRNMHMPKCPGDEMSVPQCLLPKCQVPKCQVSKWQEAVIAHRVTYIYGQVLAVSKSNVRLRHLKHFPIMSCFVHAPTMYRQIAFSQF